MKKPKIGTLLFAKEEKINNSEMILNKKFFDEIKPYFKLKKILSLSRLKNYILQHNTFSSNCYSKNNLSEKKKLLKIKRSLSVINNKTKNHQNDHFIDSYQGIFENSDLITKISKSILQNSILKYQIFEKLKKENNFYEKEKQANKLKSSKEILFNLNKNFKKSVFNKFEFQNTRLRGYYRKYILKIKN